MSTLSGLFNSFGAIGGAYLQSQISGVKTPAVLAITNVMNPSTVANCGTYAKSLGFVIQTLLNAQVPDTTFYKQVSTSIASQVQSQT